MRTRTLLAGCCALVMVWPLPAHADVSVGDKPQLRLKTLDNSIITSKDMEGKIIILEFWATWCGPCKEQIPHLREINEKYTRQGVRLISISRDDSRGPVLPFIKQNGMFWTHVIDKEQRPELGSAFGVSGIPHAFLLSPTGEVLWRGHPGGIDAHLEQALKDHPPTPSASELREASVQAIEHAVKLIDDKQDYEGAYKALSQVSEETFKDSKVQAKFKALAQRFKPVGPRAEAVNKFYEANPDARQHMERLGVDVDAQTAAAPPRANGLEAAATQRLALADKRREAGDDVVAYKLYHAIVQRYGETESGRVAAEQVAQYEADAEFMQRLKDGQKK